jgi:sulfur transfer complex TusBCD TusB component (DsrH family)
MPEEFIQIVVSNKKLLYLLNKADSIVLARDGITVLKVVYRA